MTRRTWIGGALAGAAHATAHAAISGDDVFFASLTELSARLRRKEFSSVELTKAICDRLEKLAPGYNALALMLRDEAISNAKEVDAEMKRGRVRGVLQGIPYGAKDLFAVEGKITAWGAKPYVAQKFDYSAAVVEKLAKARAPLAAKLAMVELAGGPSYSGPAASVTGPCLNPWNKEHWAGGSSSGSGAAVAAGLVPWALGTETSGSILTPAAFCGITGLRPTYGLVSRYGAMALSPSLDKIGPMCRTAEDCGLVLEALAGGDERDPGSAKKSYYHAPQFVRPFAQLKIGYAPEDFDSSPEEAARPAFRAALEVVSAMGVQVVEKKLPELPYGPAVSTIIAAEGAAEFRQLIESGQVDQLADKQQIDGLKRGLTITAADYLRAKEQQRQIREAFEAMFFEVDVLIAPSRMTVANKALEPFARTGGGGRTSLIPAGNLAGVPAISLPCGFANGLPLGLQLVARHFGENTLVALGMEFQKRTDWHQRRPPG